MATLINPIGKFKGRLGDFIFSQRNGKTVISSRPQFRKASFSQRSVQTRKKFSIASQFSKCVNSIPALKALWKNEYPDVKGNSYNIILKHFLNFVENNDIAEHTNIFPDFGGLVVSVSDISLFNNTLTVITEVIGQKSLDINLQVKPVYIQFVGIIECTNPIEPHYSKEHFFIPLNLNSIDFVIGENYNFNIYLVGHEADILNQYESFRIFGGFVFYDKSKNICANSTCFDDVLEGSPFD